MSRGSGKRFRVPWLAVALTLATLGASEAVAQSRDGMALQPPPASVQQWPLGNANPRTGNPAPTLLAPGAGAPGPQLAQSAPQAQPNLRAGEGALQLIARFSRDTPAISTGLHWRVYSDKPDAGGAFRLLKEDRSPYPTIVLPAGGYVVHVSLGLASAARPVQLRAEPLREVFDIAAGGLTLKGQVGDARIPTGQISFDIYKGSQFDSGEKRPIASNVLTGEMVLVPEGIYYIVSKYGDGNAVLRSDIRVLTGRLTDVVITHRAAAIMLKLVAKRGGEALANTDWAVLSPAGDVITETRGAFPRVILAEGEYKVIARNDNKVYQQDLKVITGVDGEIEVLAR